MSSSAAEIWIFFRSQSHVSPDVPHSCEWEQWILLGGDDLGMELAIEMETAKKGNEYTEAPRSRKSRKASRKDAACEAENTPPHHREHETTSQKQNKRESDAIQLEIRHLQRSPIVDPSKLHLTKQYVKFHQ